MIIYIKLSKFHQIKTEIGFTLQTIAKLQFMYPNVKILSLLIIIIMIIYNPNNAPKYNLIKLFINT